MLAVADGVGIVTENLFAGRFRYVDELARMGADVRTDGHHASCAGGLGSPERRCGRPTSAPAPRWSSPGSWPKGETEVSGVEHIDRGYEDFVGKLQALGADSVERVEPPRRDQGTSETRFGGLPHRQSDFCSLKGFARATAGRADHRSHPARRCRPTAATCSCATSTRRPAS